MIGKFVKIFYLRLTGEPDAVKVARPVRGGGVGKAAQLLSCAQLAGLLPYEKCEKLSKPSQTLAQWATGFIPI